MTDRRWNYIINAVNNRIPEDKLKFESEEERDTYRELYAKKQKEYERTGFWFAYAPVESEYRD